MSGVLPKAVVAFAGARDAYQVQLALAQVGLLEALVTDRYFPPWLSPLFKLVGRSELTIAPDQLPPSQVKVSLQALAAFASEKLGGGSDATWSKSRAIGVTAREIAFRKGTAVLSYSTSGFEALRAPETRWKFLFQYHPHPGSVRDILQQELERLPWAAASLRSEPELALPEDKFRGSLRRVGVGERNRRRKQLYGGDSCAEWRAATSRSRCALRS